MNNEIGKIIGIAIVFLVNGITIFLNTKWIINMIIGLIPDGIEVVAMNPVGVLSTSLTISFLGSLVIILPILVFYLLSYLKDALYSKEKKAINKILLFGTGLFALGAGLAFYSFINFGLEWFASFNIRYGIATIWSLTATINTFLMMGFFAGLLFEFPIVLFYLIRWRIFEFHLDMLKRMYIYGSIFLLIGLIGADGAMFSQLFLGVPMIILIESAVYFGNKYKEVKKC